MFENLVTVSNNANNSINNEREVNTPTAFQPIVPLESQENQLTRFPVDALPSVLREQVEALSLHTQTAPDMAAVVGLGVIAMAIQGKVKVEGNIGYYEQTSLYCAIIAGPGERKSSVIRGMTSVIEDYEKEFNEKLKPKIRSNHQEREKIEMQIRRLTKQLEYKPDKNAELKLQHQRDLLADLPEIKQRRFFADDCTPEKLTDLLAENNGRMSIFSAEGNVFDMMAGQYSKKPKIEIWLKGICGDTIRVDRVGREALYIRNPALTMVVAAQPEVLSTIMQDKMLGGRGLLARFLYANIPDYGSRTFRSVPMSENAARAYHDLVFRLMDIPEESEIKLTLSEAAVTFMSEYFSKLDRYLHHDGSDMKEWGNKLSGMILRIAGILHIAEGNETTIISEETLQCACRIGNYAMDQARYAFSLMRCDMELEKCRFVMAKIRRNKVMRISQSALFQLCRSKFFHSAAEFTPTLLQLEAAGHVYIEAAFYCGTGRPPTPTIHVNPLVYETDVC